MKSTKLKTLNVYSWLIKGTR